MISFSNPYVPMFENGQLFINFNPFPPNRHRYKRLQSFVHQARISQTLPVQEKEKPEERT